ncbi:MAG: urease subunit beta [Trueperaceae bacterium]|nr:urease subunit beta [Trueperaceae bacterium]
MIPGEIFTQEGEIELNKGRETLTIRVDNRGDRPIQVGSHTHFFEVNKKLAFKRELAYGFHLNIPAGTALRFEPGEGREIELVAFGGKRQVYGMNALVSGDLLTQKTEALQRIKAEDFEGAE